MESKSKEKAQITNAAWDSVHYSFIRTNSLGEKDSETIFSTLINKFNQSRSAIYHGKALSDEE